MLSHVFILQVQQKQRRCKKTIFQICFEVFEKKYFDELHVYPFVILLLVEILQAK